MMSSKKMSKLGKTCLSLVAFLTACTIISAPLKNYLLPTENKNLPTPSPTLKALSQGVTSLAKSSKKGLVFISTVQKAKTVTNGARDPFLEFFFGRRPAPRQEPKHTPQREGLGSGFLVDLEKGYIVTNNHVVDGADTIEVKLANGSKYEATVVGKDSNTDVAVIKIKTEKYNRKGLNSLVLDDSDQLEVGSFVVALGAPFRLEASITFGVVSATGRGSLAITGMGDFIQTDAAINPGNSGGPLLNVDGKIIGMNTAIYSKSGGYNGVGFAIPSNLVRRVATSLINEGKVSRGYIGVRFQPMPSGWSKTLKLPKNIVGVIVSEVTKGGPADRAGVKSGDILYQVGTKKFEKSSDLSNAVGLMKPGNKTTLKLYRNGKDISLELEIGLWPDSESTSSKTETPAKVSKNPFGFITKPLSVFDDEFISTHKIKAKNGLVIIHVEENSIAAKIGLRKYDVITSANLDTDVIESPSKLDKFLSSSTSDSPIIIGVERDSIVRYVELKK